jgi:hypothetical protein
VRLHEEKLQHAREIGELKEQLKCINLNQQLEDGDNLVSDVDDDVDQHKQPTSNPQATQRMCKHTRSMLEIICLVANLSKLIWTKYR